MNFAWFEPWRSRWNALGGRERRAATLLAGFLGVVLFYLLIWNPVEGGLAKARARLPAVREQLAQVREQAALVAKVRAQPRAAQTADPSEAVKQAAERNGLREQLKGVNAEGSRAVRVQIEGATFPALMALLVEVYQQTGLRAESATFERSSNPGTVNARFVLKAQGI